ncbi:MAG: hypothetical protein M3179_12435 [Actinomycetota bacterium]|nr:hypothetical protein [Actinomycetota bacterium]
MKRSTRIVRTITALAVAIILVGLAKPLGRPGQASAQTSTPADGTAPVVEALTPPPPDAVAAPSVVPEPAPALPAVPALGIPGAFPHP